MKTQRSQFYILLSVMLVFLFISCGKTNLSNDELTSQETTHTQIHSESLKKYDSLVTLGWQLVTTDPGRVRELALEASMHYHEKDIRRKLMILNLVGITYSIQSEHDKAMDNLMEGLSLALKHNDYFNASTFYNNIGIINFHNGQYHEALQIFFKAIELFDKSGEEEKNISTLNNIGEIYSTIGNFDKAKQYLDLAHEGFANISDSVGIASIHVSRGKMHRNMNTIDSAVYHLSRAIEICQLTENKFSLSESLIEMAKVFSQHNKFEEALQYYSEAKTTSDEINYLKISCEAMIGMARTNLIIGKLSNAIANADEAMTLALQLENNNLKKDIHKVYADIYQHTSAFQKSNYHLNEYLKLNEKINDQQRLHKLYNIEIQELSQAHEIQKLKIERQELLISKKNTQLIFVISAFLSVMAGLVLLYRNFRYRQAAAHQKVVLDLKEKKARAAVIAEIRERTRIGQELHDGLGQMLTVARMNISVMQQKDSLSPERKTELLDGALSGVDKAFSELRNICQNLASKMLIEKGLTGALRDTVDQLNKSQNIIFHFEHYGFEKQFDKLIENTIFRAAQELLHNAVKHSNAKSFFLQLVQNDKEINMIAEDDGIGFDYKQISGVFSGGLYNIKSRVENLNGTVYIDTRIKRGTIITIQIPLHD